MRFRDAIPDGFQVPAGGLNLHVTDGNGVALAYLGIDLFGTGLELVDPTDTQGALVRYSADGGTNIAVVTYDLQLRPTVVIGSSQINTAKLSNYASVPGGPNFLPNDLTDDASVGVKGISVVKQLTATDQPFTTGSNLAIGEVGTYTVTITVPQGTTPSARLVDTLPNGLAIVGLDSLSTNSPGLVFASAGTFDAILATAQATGVTPGGFTATFDFGDIQNNDQQPANVNTITAVYRVVALNVSANTNGRSQTNQARFYYSNTSTAGQTTATIRVPRMQVSKEIDDPTADAHDTVTYTVTINHAGNSGTDAFDVSLADILPAGVTFVAGTLQEAPGSTISPSALGYNPLTNTIEAAYNSFPRGRVGILQFQALVAPDIQAFQTVINTAPIQYKTLHRDNPEPISPYNPNSYERTGNPADPGGSANNLNASASASFTPTPAILKELIGTDQSFTTGNDVAIGESAQYRVTLTIPEGVAPSSFLTDTLPPGLALVRIHSLVATASLGTSRGSFDTVKDSADVEGAGRLVTLNFGTLTNSATDNSPQTITIVYDVVALNVGSNVDGAKLANLAEYASGSHQIAMAAPELNVVLPRLAVDKVAGATWTDAGVPITYRITIRHDATSTIDAFNVSLVDPLPPGLTLIAGTLRAVSGTKPTSLTVVGTSIVASFDQLPLGESSTLEFQAAGNASSVPGSTLTNIADIQYTTLPNPVVTPISPHNPFSTERTGNPEDPGGTVNNLSASDNAPVQLRSNSLAGVVFVDPFNTGVLRPDSPRISGVTITLSGTDSLGLAVLLTAQTGALGTYSFTGLRPGSYVITEAQPSAYLTGKNTIGTQGGIAAPPPSDVLSNIVLPLGASTDGTGNNFAELIPSSLAGGVFVDVRENGIRDPGDPGIPGVMITLTGTDDIGSVRIVVATDAGGNYAFPNLRPGTYAIGETQPTGFVTTINTIGTQGGAVLPDDVLGKIAIGPGVVGTGNNFGERYASSLAGTVFLDSNNNGRQDPGEPGIAGVAIALGGTDVLGQPVFLTTATDPNGHYLFANLRSGAYALTETQPAGYFTGINTIGSQGGTADPPPADSLTNIVLPALATNNGVGNNFGELLPAGLDGCGFWDVNQDRKLDSPDFGIAGVTVTLTGTNDLREAITLVTTTDANGQYAFHGLRPGAYTIRETQPAGFRNGVVLVGTLGGKRGRNQVTDIIVRSGNAGNGYCFGEIVPNPPPTGGGCCSPRRPRYAPLFNLAYSVGNKVSTDLALRAQNPARFDRLHPEVGPLLAQGIVPRGVDGYPKAPRAYAAIPTLGTKRLIFDTNPRTGQVGIQGRPNFPPTGRLAAGHFRVARP
ncbi:MAG: SdrD B-like domain-containing protein [Isosphaeraceae bacterium]